MPNKPSAKKRMRQNIKRRERNRAAKSALKSMIKSAIAAPADPEKTRQALRTIGKTAKRGIIHPNKAARLASRLQRRVNALRAAQAGVPSA